MSLRSAGSARKYSLEQPPRRRQQIRRQFSTEDDINLDIYPNNASLSRTKYIDNASTCDYHRNFFTLLDRPKVRAAWNEQLTKPKNIGEVEIIAHKISTLKPCGPSAGQGNNGTLRRCPLAEKATILYSRQELAERLRLAWQQREDNKSNIEIFLAHSTVKDICDSSLSARTNRTMITSTKIKQKCKESDKTSFRLEHSNKPEFNSENEVSLNRRKSKNISKNKLQTWFSFIESNESTVSILDNQVLHIDNKKQENNENNKLNSDDKDKKEKTTVKKSSITINCKEWNNSRTIYDKSDIFTEIDIQTAIPIQSQDVHYAQARLKRASFYSGSNKAFTSSVLKKPSISRTTRRINALQKTSQAFRRMSSALHEHRTQVNIVIDTPSTTLHNIESEGRSMNVSDSPTQSIFTNSITSSRAIKSALSTKRRSKANKKRGLSMAPYSKHGCNEIIDNSKSKSRDVKPVKNLLDTRSTDIVTMVSLISSVDSESEMDENSLKEDKLICDLRNKLPSTPIIKSSIGLSSGFGKPFKSVSFQQDSFDLHIPSTLVPPQQHQLEDLSENDAMRTSLLLEHLTTLSRASASRDMPEHVALLTTAAGTLIACTASTVTTTTITLTTMTTWPLNHLSISGSSTDREKRCLAVPIIDVLDKKKKFARCTSATALASRVNDIEEQSSDTGRSDLSMKIRMSQATATRTLPALQDTNQINITTNLTKPKPDTNLEEIVSEPYFQIPKEKECWHLYKKMCDKGVVVSFDTVLRGLLTPTEYRLRQKELSQNW